MRTEIRYVTSVKQLLWSGPPSSGQDWRRVCWLVGLVTFTDLISEQTEANEGLQHFLTDSTLVLLMYRFRVRRSKSIANRTTTVMLPQWIVCPRYSCTGITSVQVVSGVVYRSGPDIQIWCGSSVRVEGIGIASESIIRRARSSGGSVLSPRCAKH